MALVQAVSALAIGLGCRRGAAVDAIVDCVRRALAQANASSDAATLFTVAGKETELSLYEAATALGLPLIFLPRDELAAHSGAAETRSQRVVDLFGVPSVAETAALAGAGSGARLVVARISGPGVTCAIARVDQDKTR